MIFNRQQNIIEHTAPLPDSISNIEVIHGGVASDSESEVQVHRMEFIAGSVLITIRPNMKGLFKDKSFVASSIYALYFTNV